MGRRRGRLAAVVVAGLGLAALAWWAAGPENIWIAGRGVPEVPEPAGSEGQRRPEETASPAPAGPERDEKTPEARGTVRDRRSRHGVSEVRDSRLTPEVGEQAIVFGEWDRGGWADLFVQPGRDPVGQALIGDLAVIVEQSGGWSRVRTAELPGSPAWVRTAALTAGSARVRTAWNRSPFFFLTRAPGLEHGRLFVPFGARLPGTVAPDATTVVLLLPDGREVGVPRESVRPAEPAPPIEEALSLAVGLRRITYRRGGNTREAFDGAGLVTIAFRVAGITLPRSAEGQRRLGSEVRLEEAQRGDVVFFAVYGSDASQPAILVDSAGTLLEASPATGVALGSLSEMGNRRVLAVRRYVNGGVAP